MAATRPATPISSRPGSAAGRKRLEAELRLLRTISSRIADCDELEPAFEILLREICKAAAWPLAQTWMPRREDSDELLELGPVGYASDPAAGERLRAASVRLTFRRGEGLVGRAWDKQSALWDTDLVADPAFRRGLIAKKLGLKSALALPIVAGGQMFAVIEFLMGRRRAADAMYGGIATDLTAQVGGLLQRVKTEAALRRSEQRFASFMKHLPAGAFIRDEHGRYLFVNPLLEGTSGRKLKDWLGKTDYELGSPALADIVETDRVVFEENRPTTRTATTGTDAEPRHWIVTKFPLPGDERSPRMLGGISVNISEQKRAEQAAREREERLRLLIDSVHDYAIYTLDTDGYVKTWNQGAMRLKGYTAEEIIGRHFSCFYTPEDIAADRPRLALATAAAEGRFEYEGWRVRKDGSRFWASAVLSCMRDESGALFGFAKVTRDLTERKRAEDDRLLLAQTAEALRVRDEILAFASHEMRTPLASLHLQLEILRREMNALSAPRQKQVVQRMERAYERMVELVESFLQYSRLQGRIVLQLESVDLGVLTGEVIEELKPQAQRKQVRVVLHTGEGPYRVESDRRFVRLILVNLVGNAIKFTERGDIEVALAVREGECRVSVRDHGPGIAAADQMRIFEPFERGESISNKHIPGVGLGLALVKRMSEAIGARIELESQVGMGSTFTLVMRGS